LNLLLNRLTVLPRGVVILIDLFIILISVCLAFLLRFNFNLKDILAYNPIPGVVVSAVAALIATLTTKSYAGIVRYTGIQDGLRIIRTEMFGASLVVMTNLLYHYNYEHNLIPFSVVFISFFISTLFLYQYRLLVKNLFTHYKADAALSVPVIIYGGGVAGFLTKQAIEADMTCQYKLAGFIDDDPKKNGKEINGTRIFSSDKLSALVKKHSAKKLIIAIKNLSIDRKNEIVDMALYNHIRVSYVTSFDKWLRNDWDVNQIRDINIEDLLGREVIKLNNNDYSEFTARQSHLHHRSCRFNRF
jgi:FlaA1/EpsC-like NDP-sugar epimerase